MLNKFKIRPSLIMLFILLISSSSLFAQEKIFRINVSPLNKVICYFSNSIPRYSSQLSPDKKKLTLLVSNSGVEDSVRHIKADGIISDVYIQTRNKDLEISIILKEKRGYTAVPNPYSHSLSIEVFRWDKLSPAEDNYRSGLLAMETGIDEASVTHLKKAAGSGIADAAAYLGIIHLKKGRINDAIDNLKYSVRNGTNVFDAYAALSQVLRMNNFNDKADVYRKMFISKTGLSGFTDLPVNEEDIINNYDTEPVSLLEMLDDPNYLDSSLTANDTSKVIEQKQDSASNRFSTLFSDSTDTAGVDTTSSESKGTPLFPEWLTAMLGFIGLFILIITLVIAVTYIKWRKRQRTVKKVPQTRSFGKDLKDAQGTVTKSASEASKAYKSGSLLDKTIDKEKAELPAPGKKGTPGPASSSTTDKKKESRKEAEEKLFQILSKISENKVKKEAPKPDPKPVDRPEKKKMSAKLEMAMHLQKEQQKIKARTIEKLKTGDIPSDVSKLSEVAKSLGIEKSGLEIRKAMENIESNKKTIDELEEKFKIKKKPKDSN